MLLNRPPIRRSLMGSLLSGLALGAVIAGCGSEPVLPTATTPVRRTAPALGPTSTGAPLRNAAGTPTTPTASLVPIPTPSGLDWVRGPASAPVTLVAYMDFQCSPCNAAALAIDHVFARHPDQVRQVYRPFPLAKVEDKADLAARLVEAAGRQDAFWTMHDALVEGFDSWRDLDPTAFRAWAIQQAQTMGLSPGELQADLDDPKLASKIGTQYAEAQASGIPGAPFVLLNGRHFLLVSDETQLEAAVRLGILQSSLTGTQPDQQLEPGKTYLALLRTNLGDIQIQLYGDTAPLAVTSFVNLSAQGWYDGTGAYQVVPGQWVGLGDPTWTGLGDAGYHYPLETDSARSFDRAGMVGVIPAGPEINGSRIFVSLTPLPEYDTTHTVLGRITQGMDILTSLSARDPLPDLLTDPELTITSITVSSQ